MLFLISLLVYYSNSRALSIAMPKSVVGMYIKSP